MGRKILRFVALAAALFTTIALAYRYRDLITAERVKTGAAVLQAMGFGLAAILTYRYGQKLEDHKSEKKIREIIHANFHSKRMENLENINRLMGTVVAKLELIPDFIDFYNLDPMPSSELEGAKNKEEREQKRFNYRVGELHKARIELEEAIYVGYLYNDDRIYESIEEFLEDVRNIITRYFGDLHDPGKVDPKSDAMANYHHRLNEIIALRKVISIQFHKQLKN